MKNNKALIYALSFSGGFLSLAVEILWMRIISFSGMSVPHAFSYTLAMFLFGIACGAMLGRKLCIDVKVDTRSAGKIFLAAGSIDLILISLVAIIGQFDNIDKILGGFVFLTALVRGIAFPVIHHIGANEAKTGRQISNVYFSNVFGSALAPLIVGFVLLDSFTTQQVYLLICAYTFFVSFVLLGLTGRIFALVLTACCGIGVATIPEHIIKEIASNSVEPNNPPLKIIENKHGIVQVYENKDIKDDLMIFGNNAYDGRLNTDIFNDTNTVSRSYMLSTLKQNAEHVLVIGLSTGAWTEVLTFMPSIKKITVVEINPAYKQLIETNPKVSHLLKDKRVKIIFDDGRKWLRKNQNEKFDLIVSNNTFHWRMYSTNLISQEFMQLAKGVLKKDGILYFNATGNPDTYYTANTVFPNVYKHRNMVLVSNSPVKVEITSTINALCRMIRPDTGKPVFKNLFECTEAYRVIEQFKLIPYSDIDLKKMAPFTPAVITDNNMIPEYKHAMFLNSGV